MAPQAPASDGRMAAANNAFAIDLYGELGAGNVFFSPNSIELALAMAFSGARGATADEMAKVLHFTAPEDAGSLGAFAAALNAPTAPDGKPRGYVLSEANALWVQKGQAILQQYLDLLRERFGAPPREVDFANDPAGATRAINTWVARNTNDKIKELMRAGDVTRETRLVLTNAIYFKGTWAAPFAEIQTRPEAFRTAAGQEEKPPMMHRTGDYAIFENGDLQALKLPYSGGELSMVVLLPRRPEGLPALDKSLTAASLDAWIGGAAREKVQVTLPKFTVEGRFLLADPLKYLGMAAAFGSGADFSGITGRKDLSISEVIHQAFVAVDEEGAEAAAATAVGIRATAMVRQAPPAIFRADHPFLFLIRHEASGAILFMGRLNSTGAARPDTTHP